MVVLEIAAIVVPSAITLVTGGKPLLPKTPAVRLRDAQKFIDDAKAAIAQPSADGIPADERNAFKDGLVLLQNRIDEHKEGGYDRIGKWHKPKSWKQAASIDTQSEKLYLAARKSSFQAALSASDKRIHTANNTASPIAGVSCSDSRTTGQAGASDSEAPSVPGSEAPGVVEGSITSETSTAAETVRTVEAPEPAENIRTVETSMTVEAPKPTENIRTFESTTAVETPATAEWAKLLRPIDETPDTSVLLQLAGCSSATERPANAGPSL